MRSKVPLRIGATSALAFCALVGLGAGQADAVEVDGGCAAIAASLDGNGKPIQTIIAADPNDPRPRAAAGATATGTKSDPVLVDQDGTIQYQATAPKITDNKLTIKVFGITVHSESDDNASGSTTKSGTEDMSDWFPVDQPGLYYVEGSYSGTGGSCSGSAWFKVVGSPVGSPLWIAGLVFAAGGAVLLAFSWPTRVGGA